MKMTTYSEMNDLSKWTNEQLTDRLDVVAREIRWRKNYHRPYEECQTECENIKKEILRRMDRKI